MTAAICPTFAGIQCVFRGAVTSTPTIEQVRVVLKTDGTPGCIDFRPKESGRNRVCAVDVGGTLTAPWSS
jgi:hypothetical protein